MPSFRVSLFVFMPNMQRRFSLLFLTLCLTLYNAMEAKALFGHEVRLVTQGEFNSVVCLTQFPPDNPQNSSMLCSGTMMTQSHIVTAEHCLYTAVPNGIAILYGNGEISTGRYTAPIWFLSYDQWMIINNCTISTVYNDISVIKIQPLMDQIFPAFISGIQPHLLDGIKTKMFGCGRTSTYGTIPERIAVGEVEVLKITDCMAALSQLEGRHIVLPLNFLCTRSNPYVHADHPDAGGPLTYFGALVGITAGLSPPMNHRWDVEKINLHVALEYYRAFLGQAFND